jgi:hypothetical protein
MVATIALFHPAVMIHAEPETGYLSQTRVAGSFKWLEHACTHAADLIVSLRSLMLSRTEMETSSSFLFNLRETGCYSHGADSADYCRSG